MGLYCHQGHMPKPLCYVLGSWVSHVPTYLQVLHSTMTGFPGSGLPPASIAHLSFSFNHSFVCSFIHSLTHLANERLLGAEH